MERKAGLTDRERKRRALLAAPVVILPFLTLFLWSFKVIGSGKPAGQSSAITGLNRKLPDARTGKDSNWNKLKFYEQSDRDSARMQSLRKADPYFKSMNVSAFDGKSDSSILGLGNNGRSAGSRVPGAMVQGLGGGRDANEEKVYKKLADLNLALRRAEQRHDTLPPSLRADATEATTHIAAHPGEGPGGKVGLGEEEEQSDQQLKRMDGMLDKILQIQHPEREKQQNKGVQTTVLSVQAAKDDGISYLPVDRAVSDSTGSYANQGQRIFNAFYSIDLTEEMSSAANAIRAIIPMTQTLVSGATVRLRLLADIYINGVTIPAGEFVYGVAALNGERLNIHISSLQYRGSILPVSLTVFDLDGITGIYVPGTITRDVTKQSTEQAIQSLSLASLDQSIGAQAASAGIEAAKSLVSRKVKLVRVTVPSGYEVLLRDENSKNK